MNARQHRIIGGMAAAIFLLFGIHGSSANGQQLPGATVLVPEFRVSFDGGQRIGVEEDTEVTLQNTSNDNVIVKAELWSQRGRQMFGPTLPLLPHQTIVFRMSQVLNGDWNLNPNVQGQIDYCHSASWYQFENPSSTDAGRAVSSYPYPALSDADRRLIWESLDSSPDDGGCGQTVDGILQTPLRGYLTIDVMNYCASWNSESPQFYALDALGTVRPGSTTNVLLASARTIDSGPNASLPVEIVPFDPALDWRTSDTFFGRDSSFESPSLISEPGPLHSGTGLNADWPSDYQLIGDGRTPSPGKKGSLYLFPPSVSVSAGDDVSFRALVFASGGGSGSGCGAFACTLDLVARPAGATTGGQVLGTAIVDAFSGEADWTVTIPASFYGDYDFFAALNGTCPQCSGNCTTKRLTVPVGTCTPSATSLCLGGGRFGLSVAWKNPYDGGSTGVGTAVSLTSDSGYFWFFTPSNIELVIKILDGRTTNGSFWVLYGALSDVEYTITITDTQTGTVKTYVNPPGSLASVADTTAFAGRPTGAGDAPFARGVRGPLTTPRVRELARTAPSALPAEAAACSTAGGNLCLNDGRFRSSVTWRNYGNGETGVGTAISVTVDSGYFWFFNPSNVELMMKVLDGRTVNGRFWVLFGSLTDVEFRLSVIDTLTGATKVYDNAAHNLGSRIDTLAF